MAAKRYVLYIVVLLSCALDFVAKNLLAHALHEGTHMEQVVLARQGPGEGLFGAVEVVEVAEGMLRTERARALGARWFAAGFELSSAKVDAASGVGK